MGHDPRAPLVSIVTVCRSSRVDLELTLEPFLLLGSRDRSLLQHIIVLGHADSSLESLALRFTPKELILFDDARGPYAAMNLGAGLAIGKYLWFLNSGDKPEITALRDSLSVILASQAQLLSFSCLMIGSQSVDLWTPSLRDLPAGTLPHPSLLFDRNLFNNLGGFDLRYKYVSDRALILKALHHCSNIQLIPIVLARYLVSPSSLSSSHRAAAEDIRLSISIRVFPSIATILDYLFKLFVFVKVKILTL